MSSTRTMFRITLGVLTTLLLRKINAFVPPASIEFGGYQRGDLKPVSIELNAVPNSIFTSGKDVNDIKLQIEDETKSTKRGRKASPDQRTKIDSLVQSLETLCPYEEPARMPEMEGKWIVDYTTAPPPSNGKLGPFDGIARQIIDLDKRTYTNYLSVPGEIEKEFLGAKLEATFEEWDGELLKDDRISDSIEGNDNEDKVLQNAGEKQSTQQNIDLTPDYGANCWKVDFKTLTIKLFGFKVLEKSFDEGTSRVWKMSYLDQDGTRVVRAGRTGKDEDAMLFYMTKE